MNVFFYVLLLINDLLEVLTKCVTFLLFSRGNLYFFPNINILRALLFER